MDSTAQTVVLMVAGVGIVAWLMKSFSGPKRDESAASGDAAAVEALIAGEPHEDSGEIVAMTSDGWAFVPGAHEVHLVPPGDDDEPGLHSHSGRSPGDILINPKTGKRVTQWKPGEHLDRGDLIAARVKRGSLDYDPYRLEGLGRDHEYRAWRFETEEAGRAARELRTRLIVVPPADADGEPVPIGEADYAAALAVEAEIEAELASMPEEEGGEAGETSKR